MRRSFRSAIAATLVGLGLYASLTSSLLASTPGEPVAQEADHAIAARLLALDPERISGGDVADVLSRFQAPRIILLQGSFAPVTMEPFASFLIAMGYPEDKLKSPRDGSVSGNSFVDSRELAGELAWYYEHEGIFPLVIGHSQGGMLAIRALYDLAGAFGDSIPVWNPVTDTPEHRTTIVDPLTGVVRPVVGLQVPYAAALATGKLFRLLLGQWTMLSKLRKIPDSVVEFTGFSLDWDLIAGHLGASDPYVAIGTAAVRNVTLPDSYTHIGLPQTAHLAANAVTRAWIEAYVPGADVAPPDAREVDTTNIVHAADIWYSVKKHWCLNARQRLIAGQVSK